MEAGRRGLGKERHDGGRWTEEGRRGLTEGRRTARGRLREGETGAADEEVMQGGEDLGKEERGVRQCED